MGEMFERNFSSLVLQTVSVVALALPKLIVNSVSSQVRSVVRDCWEKNRALYMLEIEFSLPETAEG